MLLARALVIACVTTVLAVPAYATEDVLLENLRIVAPGALGGGWDQTARAMQAVLVSMGAPAALGLILGPLAEQQFRRALAISQGDIGVFFTRPISAIILTLAAIVLAAPTVWRRVQHAGRGV